jgi:hypothetical protein
MSIKYQHLLAVDDKKGIRANVVYIKIDYNFIGAYFGYEGGGAYSDGFFWINEDEEVFVDWDTSELPEQYREKLEGLAEIRHIFESDEEEGDLSEKGLELKLSVTTNEYENHWEYWSDGCDIFVISLLSNNWGISMRWNDD